MSADPRLSEILCAEEVATLLGVGVKTVHAYHCRGQMPAATHHKGRTPLWDRAEIEEWNGKRPPRQQKAGGPFSFSPREEVMQG